MLKDLKIGNVSAGKSVLRESISNMLFDIYSNGEIVDNKDLAENTNKFDMGISTTTIKFEETDVNRDDRFKHELEMFRLREETKENLFDVKVNYEL